jgi:phosphatidate cytidylyltransferase
MKRVATAAALIPVIVYVVIWAPEWFFFLILTVAALLSYREYDGIAAAYGFGNPGWIGYPAGLAVLFWRSDLWLALVLLAILAATASMRAAHLAHTLPRAALLGFGVLYVFGCWRCAIPLREISPHWLMFALLVNWAGDAGAYYVGRAFGKHKLAPRVSPKKTVEGAAASVFFAILIAGGYLLINIRTLPWWHALAVAVLANIAGQLGDLAESAMKRGANIKDSGTLLPGHGGFLDRVDSTLFALPVVYAYVRILAL